MYWLDGRVSAHSTMPFDIADRGLLLGDAVFDTSLVLGGTMVWRAAHLARLAAACATLGFAMDDAAVAQAIDALTAAMPDGALRITVTRGSGPRGLVPPDAPTPRVFAAIAPLRVNGFLAPLSLDLTHIRRNETSPTAQLKVPGYVDAILAARVAVSAGYDDALFLNTTGHVACTTVGNIMALFGARLVTPPLQDGVLPGITRAMLLDLCAGVGIEPIERSLNVGELETADAVFVTNSLRLAARVTRLGAARLPVADTERGLGLIAALREAIRRECGIDPGHREAASRPDDIVRL